VQFGHSLLKVDQIFIFCGGQKVGYEGKKLNAQILGKNLNFKGYGKDFCVKMLDFGQHPVDSTNTEYGTSK